MISVHSLPTNLSMDITDRINTVGNSVGKNGTVFFLLCFNYFFLIVIPSVFPFVFIDFLVVSRIYNVFFFCILILFNYFIWLWIFFKKISPYMMCLWEFRVNSLF